MSAIPSRRRSPVASRALLLVLCAAACGRGDDAASPPVASRAAERRAASGAGGAGGVAGGYQAVSGEAPPAQAPAQAPAAAPPPAPAPDASAGQPPTPSSAAATEVAPASMIIRTGEASVEVDSLEPAIARVRAIAQRVGGYVANTSLTAGRDQVRSATLELKIPSPRFDEAVNGLSPIGRVETVNVRAEDVGEEYVDIAAREANARRLEARLITLLEKSAGRLSDVLAVERELARVREEIERMDGRLRFLRTRVAMSTLSVTVHEPPPIIAPGGGGSPIGEAFRDAWRNFVGFVAWLIGASGVLIPLGVIAALAWRLTRGWRRARRPAPAPPRDG